jgi:hypothetical protein
MQFEARDITDDAHTPSPLPLITTLQFEALDITDDGLLTLADLSDICVKKIVTVNNGVITRRLELCFVDGKGGVEPSQEQDDAGGDATSTSTSAHAKGTSTSQRMNPMLSVGSMVGAAKTPPPSPDHDLLGDMGAAVEPAMTKFTV